jgi:TonB family protein
MTRVALLACTLGVALGSLGVAPARAQTNTADMLRAARAAIDARDFGRAGTLLDSIRAAATTPRDSAEGFFLTALWHFRSGRDSLARVFAREVFKINPDATIYGAAQLGQEFVKLLERERHPAVDAGELIFTTNDVELAPQRLSGPPVAYPPGAWRRQAKGRVLIEGVVDTTGKFETELFEVLEVPDSALVEPVRRAMMAARFSPGRHQGKPVRTLIRIGMMVQPPPPPNPADLVRKARAHVAARRADSALALLELAEDDLVRPTPGVRAYAQLVRGLALRSLGRDSLAAAAFDAGVAGVAELSRRGVDLAPALRQLADSVRRARRASDMAVASPAGTPTALEPVDRQPAIATFPTVEYPPEMRTLRVGGTVIVEQAVDTLGRPVPGTARVVESPNPGLNAAALKAAAGATYRPALRSGRPVRVTIRQPVTFFQ